MAAKELILKLMKKRGKVLAVLAAGASVAVAAGLATPAQAALSGSDWAAATIPAGVTHALVDRGGSDPVACVPGTRFCVAIAGDEDGASYETGWPMVSLVTTDAGRTWDTYHDSLPNNYDPLGVSCAMRNVCWTVGQAGPDASVAVLESTDGGRHWTNRTPASWAAARWSGQAIDCVGRRTCWIVGSAADSQDPALLRTTDGGATWKMSGNLPSLPADLDSSYTLNAISCVTAASCVAVGGLNGGIGPATALATTNGGVTWRLSHGGPLADYQQLNAVSCLRVFMSTTCYGGGIAYPGRDGVGESVAVVSTDGGATWRQIGGFRDGGWLNSISCAGPRNCWAADAGSADALFGTSNGGASWSTVTTTDPGYAAPSVSCLSVSTCVAVADNAIQVTTDDGGLRTAR